MNIFEKTKYIKMVADGRKKANQGKVAEALDLWRHAEKNGYAEAGEAIQELYWTDYKNDGTLKTLFDYAWEQYQAYYQEDGDTVVDSEQAARWFYRAAHVRGQKENSADGMLDCVLLDESDKCYVTCRNAIFAETEHYYMLKLDLICSRELCDAQGGIYINAAGDSDKKGVYINNHVIRLEKSYYRKEDLVIIPVELSCYARKEWRCPCMRNCYKAKFAFRACDLERYLSKNSEPLVFTEDTKAQDVVGRTECIIPEGVVEITGGYISNFPLYAEGIERLYLPSTVEYIEPMWIAGLNGLKHIVIADGNKTFCTVDGVLYSKDMTVLYHCPCQGKTEYRIPEGVRALAPGAFASGPIVELDTLYIPASLEGICSGIKKAKQIIVDKKNPVYCVIDNIVFNKDKTELCSFPSERRGRFVVPESVKRIGPGAFTDSKLNELILPNNLKELGNRAFTRTCFERIELPEGLEKMGRDPFFLSEIKEVVLPASVTEICDLFREPTYIVHKGSYAADYVKKWKYKYCEID